jgi:hypothetical protein
MDLANIAKIIVESVDNSKPGFDSAMRNVQGLGGELGSLKAKIAGVAGLLGVGFFMSMVSDSIAAAAELRKMSEQTGTNVETLSALKNIAALSGTEFSLVGGTLQALTKTMYETASGTGKALLTIQSLNLSVKDSSGQLKSNSAFLIEVAQKLEGMGNATQRVAAAQKIFKGVGAEILPFLHDLAEQGELVASITGLEAQKAEEYERTLRKLDIAKKALWNTIAMQMLPAMLAFMKTVLDVATGTESLSGKAKTLAQANKIKEWATAGGIALAMVVDAFRWLGATWEIVTLTIAGLGATLVTVFNLLGSQVKEVIGIFGSFGTIAHGVALILAGNLIEGAKLVTKGWDEMGTASQSFVGDVKAAYRETLSTSAAFNAGMAKIVDDFKENSFADKFVDNMAKVDAAVLKTSSGAGTNIPIIAKVMHDAFDALESDLGKSIAKLQEELNFMQQFGIVTKSTAVAVTTFQLKEMEANGVLAEHARRTHTTVDALKAHALAQAGLKDSLNDSVESTKKYIEEVKKLNEAMAASVQTVVDQIQQMRDQIATYGMTTEQVTRYTIAQLEAKKALIEVMEGGEGNARALQLQIDKLRDLAGLQGISEGMKNMVAIVGQLGDMVGRVAAAFTNGWSAGVKSARDALKGLWADLIAMVARKYFLQFIAGVTGSGAVANAAATSGMNTVGGMAMNAGGSYLGSTALGAAGSSFMAGFTGVGVGSLAPAASSGVASYMVAQEAAYQGGTMALGSTIADAMAAIPVWGWILAAVLLVATYLQPDRGGPKGEGSFTGSYDSSGHLTGAPTSFEDIRHSTGGLDSIVSTVGQSIAGGFFTALNRYGGKAPGGASFGLAFDTDPQGTADNRITSRVSIGGRQVFGSQDRGIGRDQAQIGPEMQLEASRMILSALQASDMPAAFAAIFNTLTASTATQAQIDNAMKWADTMKGIFDLMDRNPAADADQAAIAQTATTAYQGQLAALRTLVTAYDGSQASTEALAAGTQLYYQALIQLLVQIRQVRTAIGDMFDQTARGMTMQTLDPQGQYAYLQAEANRYRDQITTATDPAEIQRLSNLINQDMTQAFGLLSPEQQRAQLQDYLDSINKIKDLVDARLKAIEAAAVADADKNNPNSVFAQATTAINAAATKYLAAADKMTAAVDKFAAAANTQKSSRVVIDLNTPWGGQKIVTDGG